jgi:hypothetical protein
MTKELEAILKTKLTQRLSDEEFEETWNKLTMEDYNDESENDKALLPKPGK